MKRPKPSTILLALYGAAIVIANAYMIWQVANRPPLPIDRGPVMPCDRPAGVP